MKFINYSSNDLGCPRAVALSFVRGYFSPRARFRWYINLLFGFITFLNYHPNLSEVELFIKCPKIIIIDYCVKLLCGFCCVHARLLWCLRVVDMASVFGCSAVRARSLWTPCVVVLASARMLQPLRSVDLAFPRGCFDLCEDLAPRADAPASERGCLGRRAGLL